MTDAGNSLDNKLKCKTNKINNTNNNNNNNNNLPMFVYIVRHEEQGYTNYVGSTLEKARKNFIDERVNPWIEADPEHRKGFDFDPLNPATDKQYDELLECFDWSIEKYKVD